MGWPGCGGRGWLEGSVREGIAKRLKIAWSGLGGRKSAALGLE